jgi:hypothetical protein
LLSGGSLIASSQQEQAGYGTIPGKVNHEKGEIEEKGRRN